jgi:RNA ligase (TIGR02306 family)
MSEITRKMASIQRVAEVKSIEGADLICAYKINGWWVVDQVGKYQVGDLTIYCEIDSWIPTKIAPFLSKGKEPREYFGVKGERLRTVRLKGQLSQGLIMPLSVLGVENYWRCYIPPNHWTKDSIQVNHEEGSDCTEFLGIQKWEAPVNAQLAGIMKGNWPHFIQKTDQERIQNIQREITDAFNNKDEFEVTVKLDGSSCTVYYNNNELGVCSRNIDLKLDQEGNAFVDIAKKTGLIDALTKLGRNIAVQGELMGPGIQGNKEDFKENRLFVFDIYDIDNQCYFSVTDRMDIFRELQVLSGCMYLDLTPLDQNHFITLPSDDIDKLLKLAEGSSINAKIREGIVFKRLDGKFSFKIINNEFLLKDR